MKIGFIGLGIMGESMCENIVKKHDDTVYCFDFVPAKVELLASKGAVPCKDSVELATKADVIISMVPKSEHSMSVYKTILPVLCAGKTCIDMSTIDPSVSVEISKIVKATGAAFMDAPVVKSKPAAIAGKLGIYMGGDEATCEAMRPILAYMGENIIRMGGNGKGQKSATMRWSPRSRTVSTRRCLWHSSTASRWRIMPQPSPTAAGRTSIWMVSGRSCGMRTIPLLSLWQMPPRTWVSAWSLQRSAGWRCPARPM